MAIKNNRRDLPIEPRESEQSSQALLNGDGAFTDTPLQVAVLQNQERADNFDEMIRTAHSSLSELIRNPRGRNKIQTQSQTPGVELDNAGQIRGDSVADTYALMTEPGVVAPRPALTLPTSGHTLATYTTSVPASGLVSGDTTLSLSGSGMVALQEAATETILSCAGDVALSRLEVVSFRWADDATSLTWGTVDTAYPSGWTGGSVKILAVRVRNIGCTSIDTPGSSLQLNFIYSNSPSEPFLTVGSWAAVITTAPVRMNTPLHYATDVDGGEINPLRFVCNPGGDSVVPGVFMSAHPQAGKLLQPGDETELWYSMQRTGSATAPWILFRMDSTDTDIYPMEVFAPNGAWGLLV